MTSSHLWQQIWSGVYPCTTVLLPCLSRFKHQPSLLPIHAGYICPLVSGGETEDQHWNGNPWVFSFGPFFFFTVNKHQMHVNRPYMIILLHQHWEEDNRSGPHYLGWNKGNWRDVFEGIQRLKPKRLKICVSVWSCMLMIRWHSQFLRSLLKNYQEHRSVLDVVSNSEW